MNNGVSTDWQWTSKVSVLMGVDDRLELITYNVTTDKMASSNNDSSSSYSSSTPIQLAAQVAIGAVLSLLCLITVLGNTLVIHAVRTDRKLQTVSR